MSPGPVLVGGCLHAHPAQRRDSSPFSRFHRLSARLACCPSCMLNSVHFYLKQSVAQTFCKIQVDGLLCEEFSRKGHWKLSPFPACYRAPRQSSLDKIPNNHTDGGRGDTASGSGPPALTSLPVSIWSVATNHERKEFPDSSKDWLL